MLDYADWLKRLAEATGVPDRVAVPQGVVAAIGILYAALIVGSVIRLAAAPKMSAEQRKSRLGSLLVWWLLAVTVTACLVSGKWAAATFLAIAGLLGLREFLALTWDGRQNRAADALAYVAVGLQFFLVLSCNESVWTAALPVGLFLIVAVRLTLTGATVGYLHDFGTLYWAAIVTGYLLAYAVAVVHLPCDSASGNSDWSGWFLYLLVLTEGNDIAQALWGRQFGRHRVTPTISPNKTWEGLLFGGATTIVAGAFIAPLLTPLDWNQALGAGAVIAVSGFFGDINMSAFKRDVGVKDSSRLLPGQGGILDRIDSLSFAAPAFYYYARWTLG